MNKASKQWKAKKIGRDWSVVRTNHTGPYYCPNVLGSFESKATAQRYASELNKTKA